MRNFSFLSLQRRSVSYVAAALVGGALLTVGPSARADDLAARPKPFTYVLSVGSNEGGEGQEKLRFAEEDAGRVAQIFRDLGSYGQSDFRVLKHPTGLEVVTAVDDIRTKLQAHKAKGEEAVFLFYYSGHARANALNVGKDELPLGLLRDRLLSMPATLTLVFLDACQSGAFARVKGAEAAADFSYNSVAKLRTKGIAVLASSAANELSQESDDLRSSYFTSAIVTGLRGAADADGDGKVSLAEAYQYAYRRTLAATTRTKVGGQHATLETDLSGLGDVALTYPRDARAKLELPDSLEGRVLVQQKSNSAIAAEVYKAKGAPVRLALTAGVYDITVRPTVGAALGCQTKLDDNATTLWSSANCSVLSDLPGARKGDGEVEADAPPPPREKDPRDARPWNWEFNTGFSESNGSAYMDRLSAFGYKTSGGSFIDLGHWRAETRVGRKLTRNLRIMGQATFVTGESVERIASGGSDLHSFFSVGLTGVMRAFIRPFEALELFAEANLGLGIARTSTTVTGGGQTHDAYAGPVVGGAVGMSVGAPFYFTMRAGNDFSPVLRNRLGDTHNTGGFYGVVGLGYRFGE